MVYLVLLFTIVLEAIRSIGNPSNSEMYMHSKAAISHIATIQLLSAVYLHYICIMACHCAKLYQLKGVK